MKSKKTLPLRLSLALLISIASFSTAHATLLTDAYKAQLTTWLGQGDLSFTNIYTKTPGDKTFDFHAAVDGKGPTFVLFDIFGSGSRGTFDLPDQIVGGYDPQSWGSTYTLNYAVNDADRTAFIFNLTNQTIQRERKEADDTPNSKGFHTGQYQTYNWSGYGPTFGNGDDLTVSNAAGSQLEDDTLDEGYAANYSYGKVPGAEIVFGGPNYDISYVPGAYSYFHVGELEVYTFDVLGTNIPTEPTGGSSVDESVPSMGLLGASLLLLGAMRLATPATLKRRARSFV